MVPMVPAVKDRWFRSDEPAHGRARRDDFDAVAEGQRHGPAPEVVAEIWRQLRHEDARDGTAWDDAEVRQRFARIATGIAARGGTLGPAMFKWTQSDAAAGRVPARFAAATLALGKTTQVLARAADVAPCVPGQATLVDQPDASSTDAARSFVQRYIADRSPAPIAAVVMMRDHHAQLAARRLAPLYRRVVEHDGDAHDPAPGNAALANRGGGQP